MSDENKPTPIKRVIVPSIVFEASPESIMTETLTVIHTEILKFRKKTNAGQSLSPSEGRLLQGYIKALVDIARESRERDENADLANMSDDDLLKLVQTITAKKAQKNGS